MKQVEFVEYVIKLLVSKPDDIEIKIKEGENTNVIEVHAAIEDYGKIIGRNGRFINAIRVLLGVISRDSEKRWVIDVPDKEERTSAAGDDADVPDKEERTSAAGNDADVPDKEERTSAADDDANTSTPSD